MHRKSLGRRTVESLALALAPRPGLSILDGDGREDLGRASFVASDPVRVFEAGVDEPLAIFDELGAQGVREAMFPRDVGYVAYDAAFPGRTLPGGLPPARFARYDAVIRVDERSGDAELLGVSAEAVRRLEAAIEDAPQEPLQASFGSLSEDDPEAHLSAIARALEHIAAGDLYQLNLTRRWTAGFRGSPLALYLLMRRASPVPLGFFQAIDDTAILARTMETFLLFDPATRTLRTRPIKGTRARDGDDDASARALLDDDKEHAEHSMIVDLMRNDLGRVAEVGSVEVEAPFRVESYARLQHLVSVVRAQVREDVSVREVFEATFPPGSVTGTPKLRAMRRIDELELRRRGVYCGAVGHLRHDGGYHFAVAIRTALLAEGTLQYHAGGGIVAASDARRELEETRLKARVFLDALESLTDGGAMPYE
jgi:anthranilate/para-aminobenzoate synthase component I